jgi:iron complex transport system permease protein
MEDRNLRTQHEMKSTFGPFLVLSVVLILFFMLDLFIGSYHISIPDILKSIFDSDSVDPQIAVIVNRFRIPKALTALLAGAALSVAGLQMQTVFRNPLAGPFVLGISSGASLGVAILVLGMGGAFFGGAFTVVGSWSVAAAAWIGAGIILLLVLAVSTRIKDIMTILILGILFSSATAAIVSILQYFSNESMLKSFVVWTMGSLGGVTSAQLQVLLPAVLTGLLIAVFSTKFLDAFLLGENYARSMGVNITLSRVIIFISTCILAGSITAFCGPIGFIGIAVPHIVRMFFRTSNHKKLIPGSILLGSSVMLGSDIISQLPGAEATLPINSVTALMGIPIVVWIIVRSKNVEF